MKIPFYQPQVPALGQGPNTLVDSASYAIEAQTQAKQWQEAGKSGEKLGVMGSEFAKAMAEARNVSDLAGLKLQSRKALSDFEPLLAGESDPVVRLEKLEKRAQEIYEEGLKGSEAPVVQAAFKNFWASYYPQVYHRVQSEGRQAQIRKMSADLEARIPEYQELYATAKTDEEKAGVKGDFLGDLAEYEKAGLLFPEKAEKLRQGFDQGVMVAGVQRDIRLDPATAYRKLQEPEKYYPGLLKDENLLRQLQGQAHSSLGTLQKDNVLKLQQALEAGTLTPEGLLKMRNGLLISPGTFATFDAALQAPRGMRNENLFNELWIKANQGQLTDKEKDLYSNIRGGLIDTRDAERLQHIQGAAERGQTLQETAFTKNLSFQWALKDFKHRLEVIDKSITAENMKQKLKGTVREQPLASDTASMELVKACQEEAKQRPVTDKFITEKYQEIMGAYIRMTAPGAVKGRAGLWPGDKPAPARPPAGGIRNDQDWMSPNIRGSR